MLSFFPAYPAAMRSCLSCFYDELQNLRMIGIKKEQDAQDPKRQDVQD